MAARRRSSSLAVVSRSAAETKRLARRLAPLLGAGDVVLFLAQLGAGKTTFVQGFVSALGAREEALSPTFIIAQSFKGKKMIHHLDCYRLSAKETLEMGIDDYLLGRGAIAPGIVLIEWAERIKTLWPPERLEISIAIKRGSTDRAITLTARGARFENVLASLRR